MEQLFGIYKEKYDKKQSCLPLPYMKFVRKIHLPQGRVTLWIIDAVKTKNYGFSRKKTFFAIILHAHSHAFFMHDNAVFFNIKVSTISPPTFT
jgi:hypothetical protein